MQFVYLLTYLIFSVRGTANGWDGVQSMGEGIEREVLQTAFQEFQDHPTMWFLQRQETHSSLVTLGLQRRQESSTSPMTQRSIKLSVLGALTSLLLLNGVPPVPLSPVLLHYFIHDSDLNSISPDLLGNWYPDLGKLIQVVMCWAWAQAHRPARPGPKIAQPSPAQL
jgi:hypothetical protein